MSLTGPASITREELAELFREAGHRHHEAFAGSDGADPEWALWYAGYLQAHLWDRLGRVLTRSEIVYLLVASDLEARAQGVADWPSFYAERFLEFAPAANA
jgi:NAD(P)H-hydrate epimerase